MANNYIRHGETYNGDGTLSTTASGSTVTITIASPGVVTWTGHTFIANDVVYLGTTGALPTGLTAGTKYYVRNPAANTFELSATSGGASINTSGTQSGTHTATTPGAWNHIDILEGQAVNTVTGGTQGGGSIAAGDVVYIKSTDNASANITRTLAANTNLGSSVGTSTSWVTWILDNGTVWTGSNGTLTHQNTGANNYTLTLRDYNRFISKASEAWVYKQLNTSPSTNIMFSVGLYYGSTAENWFIDLSAKASSYNGNMAVVGTLKNCHLKFGLIRNDSAVNMGWNGSHQWIEFDNCGFELTDSAPAHYLFNTNNLSNTVFRGGKLYGSGLSSAQYVFYLSNNNYPSQIYLYGFKVPGTIDMLKVITPATFPLNLGKLIGVGADGSFGGITVQQWGYLDSRYDGNYPYLDAVLPTSASQGWSWKLHPRQATDSIPAEVAMMQCYANTAASKTITLNFLTSNTFAGLNKNNVWMEVAYIDNTSGEWVYVSTRDIASGSLDTNTESWLPSANYGAITMNKNQLSLTTATSIKQDTAVHVTFFCAKSTTNDSDIFIIDPAVRLT